MTLLVSLIISAAIFAFLFLFFGRLSYKSLKKDKKYDILVDFPFDLAYSPSPYSFLSRIFYILSILSFAAIPGALVMGDYPGLASMAVFLIATLIIYAAASSGVMMVSSTKTKPHLVSAFAFFLLGGFSSFFAGLLFFQFRIDHPLLSWLLAVLLWVLALLHILIAVNPKLANWQKMNVVESVNGSYLEKPRPFWLAFSEWLAIILQAILFLILSIGLLCVCLL